MTKEELKNKRIGILMGGISPEREISLKTGEAILKALKEKGYQVVKIEVDQKVPFRLIEEKIEIAFIALHGPWGEDGTIQGMLEIMGIPYTGSGVLASALAMNKVMAKRIFLYHNLPTPEFQVLNKKDPEIKLTIIPPLVVKPVCGGSTIGTSVVRSYEEIKTALQKASLYSDELLIEKYVEGTDLTVGILEGKPLPLIQIIPKSGFYDYSSKYTPGETEYRIPAPLPQEVTRRAQKLAVSAFQALQCSGVARVDLRLTPQEELTILEVNTIPGFTETSLLPMAAAKVGIDFPNLTELILCSAKLHITNPIKDND